MKELDIFVFKQKAVVDSRDIAEVVGRPHRQLLRSVQTMIGHMKHYNAQSQNGFSEKVKITERKSVLSEEPENNERKSVPVGNNKIMISDFFIPSTYIDEKGEERPCFLCTRLGCDMIANKMTGEKGTLFTAAYVTKFRRMEKELATRHELREVGKPVQRELTDAIRDSGEAQRMHGHAFNTYTNLIYRAALGQTAPQIRKARNAPKDAHAVDYLTSDELRAVEKKKRLVTDLLDDGYSYEAIRSIVHPKGQATGAEGQKGESRA